MDEKGLSEHIRRYYEGKRLPAARLECLAIMGQVSRSSPEKNGDAAPSRARFSLRSWTVASLVTMAVVLVAFIGAFSLGHITGSGQSTSLVNTDLTALVAKEIALNHNKRLNVEFPARDYAELRKKMGKLDFPMIASVRFKGGQYQLLGGRYCSLQGQLAAQIRLKDERGRVHTLYQTPVSDVLGRVAVGERQIDGLRLSLWREAGLLFGLASPQD